jgi:hypothetical protein
MKLLRPGVLLCIACLAGSGSGSAGTQAAERFTCTLGASKRLINIYRGGDERDAGRCHVEYTKDGSTKTVWSATGDYASCVKQAVTLVTKLSRSNYSCTPTTVEPSDAAPP